MSATTEYSVEDPCVLEDVRVVEQHNLKVGAKQGPTFYAQVFFGMRNTLYDEAVEKNSSWEKKYAEAVKTAHTAIKLGMHYKYMSPLGLRAQQKRFVPNRAPLDVRKLPTPKV
jgi:hypothetical protein